MQQKFRMIWQRHIRLAVGLACRNFKAQNFLGEAASNIKPLCAHNQRGWRLETSRAARNEHAAQTTVHIKAQYLLGFIVAHK